MNGRSDLKVIAIACAASALLTGCAALGGQDACGGGVRRPVNLQGSVIDTAAHARPPAGLTSEDERQAAPEQGVP